MYVKLMHYCVIIKKKQQKSYQKMASSTAKFSSSHKVFNYNKRKIFWELI